jgi:hypothetical protein
MTSGASPDGTGCGVAPEFDDEEHVRTASGGAGSWAKMQRWQGGETVLWCLVLLLGGRSPLD